jgi:hypothetical protein
MFLDHKTVYRGVLNLIATLSPKGCCAQPTNEITHLIVLRTRLYAFGYREC